MSRAVMGKRGFEGLVEAVTTAWGVEGRDPGNGALKDALDSKRGGKGAPQTKLRSVRSF